jgi:hypothetical protein
MYFFSMKALMVVKRLTVIHQRVSCRLPTASRRVSIGRESMMPPKVF